MCLRLVRCVLLLDDSGSPVIFLGENTSFAKALVKSADGFVQKWRIELNFDGRQTSATGWGQFPHFFHDFATSPTLVPEVKSLPIHIYIYIHIYIQWQTRKEKSTEQFVASLTNFHPARHPRWSQAQVSLVPRGTRTFTLPRGRKRLLTDKRLNPEQMADSRLSCISIRYLQLKMLDTCRFCDRSPKD